MVSWTLGRYCLKLVPTPLWAACPHGEWGAGSHLLGGETARCQANLYSSYKTLISLFGVFNWTWIWSFLLLSKTILDLWAACWAPGQTLRGSVLSWGTADFSWLHPSPRLETIS